MSGRENCGAPVAPGQPACASHVASAAPDPTALDLAAPILDVMAAELADLRRDLAGADPLALVALSPAVEALAAEVRALVGMVAGAASVPTAETVSAKPARRVSAPRVARRPRRVEPTIDELARAYHAWEGHALTGRPWEEIAAELRAEIPRRIDRYVETHRAVLALLDGDLPPADMIDTFLDARDLNPEASLSDPLEAAHDRLWVALHGRAVLGHGRRRVPECETDSCDYPAVKGLSLCWQCARNAADGGEA